MNGKLKVLVVGLMVWGSVFASKSCVVQNYVATYQITTGGHHVGAVSQHLTQSAGHYQFTSVTQTKVLFFHDVLNETSEGELTKAGFQPALYHLVDQKQGSIARITFNWKTKQADSLLKGAQKIIPIKAGYQDNLSFQLQLRYDLLSKQPVLDFTVLNANAITQKQFKIISQHAQLKTAAGTLDTIQVESNPDSKGMQLMYWFAPKDNDVLAQSMTLVDGNPKVTATLTSYKGRAC